MADDRGAIRIPVILENQTSAEFKRVQAEGTKLSQTFQTVERRGSSAFRSIVADAGVLQRAIQRFTAFALIPFGAGAIFNLGELLLSPFTAYLAKLKETKQALLDIQQAAAAFGQASAASLTQARKALFANVADPSKGITAGDASAAVGALGAGARTEDLDEALRRAKQLHDVFGIDIPAAARLAAGAISGNAEAMRELEQVTQQQVQTTDDVGRAFANLSAAQDLIRVTEQIKALEQTAKNIRATPELLATSELGRQIDLLKQTKAGLEDVLNSVERFSPAQREATESAKRLALELSKTSRTAFEAIPVTTFEQRITQMRQKTEVEIDAIVHAAQKALADLLRTSGRGASGPAGAAVIQARDSATAAVRARADAQERAIRKEQKDARIKDVLELQKMEDDAQLRRLQKQEEWAENVANQANRIGDVLAGVWEQYDQGLISSSQLTKSIIRGLIQEFRGDLTKQLTKAFVTAIFSGAANSGGGGGSGTTTFIETGARGLTAGPSGIMGGTKISDATFWHSYRNNPVIGMDAGGIVHQPTTFVAGEGGKEAVIPLDSGGKVPVRISGGAGGGVTVNVKYEIQTIDQTGMDAALSRSHKQLVGQVVSAIRSNNYGARDAVRGA